MTTQKSYNAKDITVLEGLDAVRLRPGMYIGTTGPKGLHHLIWEILDNSIDEAANGFCSRILLTLNVDGSVTIEDDGRGIPVDIHPVLKISAVEVVYTQLHAGGKFNNENYAYSGGLHGVGASVVNALSRWLIVEVNRDGNKYQMRFESKENANGKVSGGVPVAPLSVVGKSIGHGTKVTFMPDDRIFETIEFDYATINKHIREQAFLNKGLEICLTDARNPENIVTKSYKYDGGIQDFAKYLTESKTKLYDDPIYFEGTSGDVRVEVAMCHTDEYVDNIFSYVNNIPTSEGGTHEVGFKSGITKVLNDLARKNNIIKDKDANFVGEDFREGLCAVISIKMKNVQFEGQTKAKLGNPEARPAVETVTIVGLTDFFAGRGTGKILSVIIEKAQGAARVREAGRKAKELARQASSLENNASALVGKLAACSGKFYANNELFIVEGNSAGGSAKQARDRHFQAVLPLRGKPLNVEKKRLDQVLQNEEFRTLITALGTGIGEKFSLDNLRYHKVIILADADQDGAHIRAILLTFFYRYMRDLITEGHVYMGMPPLYKLKKKDMVEYVYSDAEIDEAISRFGSNYKLSRYKGLGEMNPEELWATTLDPKQRTIVQVTIEDAAEAEKLITTLMGDNIDARKKYISENADFNKVDSALRLFKKK